MAVVAVDLKSSLVGTIRVEGKIVTQKVYPSSPLAPFLKHVHFNNRVVLMQQF